MADTVTAELGLTKPEVNGPDTENVWGYDLNDNFDKIDLRFSQLPESDAPLDGDFYGRRQGAWQRGTMHTDFDALSVRVTAVEAENDAQDTALAGKADTVHQHVADDVTDLGEAIDDRVAALLTAGPGMVVNYDDVANKITLASTGGGTGGGGGGLVAPGDYGEITVTNDGFTWAIDPGVVTYNKLQPVGPDKLLGNTKVVPGGVEEIACTPAGRALLDDADAAAQRTTLGLSSMATEDAANFQHVDATLTALAALDVNAGLLEQTGADAFAKRTIGTGTLGSIPTFADNEARYQPRDATLVALSYLDGVPGLLEITGQDVFTKRPIGPAGGMTAVPTFTDGDARWATLNSPVFTGDARCVTPASTDNDTSIATTAFVKAVAVNKAGDTISGNLTVGGNFNTNQINCTNLYPSGGIYMPIGAPIYLYNISAANQAYIQCEPASGDMLFVTGTGGPGVRQRIQANGNVAFGASVSANIFTANAVNSNGNMSTAGTHYAGAFSAPAGTITNFNCTNIVAASNMTSNGSANVAGTIYVGGSHNYGAGQINGGLRVEGNITTPNALNCSWLHSTGDAQIDATCYITGPCYAGGFFPTGSDERLKEDLQPVANAQEILAATEVWDFLWTDGWRAGERDYGVMAQHAINVLPSAVHHDEEKDMWGVDYAKYVPILIQAVKDLRAEIVELKEQLGHGRARH